MAVRSPVIRQLAMPDLLDVLDLEGAVTARLTPGFIRLHDESEVRGFLDGTRGAAFGVVEDGALSAVSLLRMPSAAFPNRVTAVPFPRVPVDDWALGACFLENTMVRRSARGRGFQRLLFEERVAHAARAKMKWVCSGVHLDNTVSWSNLLAKGMAIVGIRFDLGHPVIGLLKALDNEAALASDPNDHLLVELGEAKRHEAALDAGYVGVRPIGDTVVYQRLLSAG
jgi:hypothetical protein